MITVLGKFKRRIDRGWGVTGSFQFNATDLSGYLPIDTDCTYLTRSPQVWSLDAVENGAGVQTVEVDQGTISASANFEMQSPIAGSISAAQIVVHTTVATDAANIWTIGIINKASGAGTNVAVDITNAANSNNATGGTAFTANTPRVLTLSGTAANLVVAAGDQLEWTFTKASSAPNLVALELLLQVTPSVGAGGESVGANVSSLVVLTGQSAGLVVPTYITSITPNAYAIPITRVAASPTNNLICGYAYEGGKI